MDELEALFFLRFMRKYSPRFMRTCYVFEKRFHQSGCFGLPVTVVEWFQV